MRKLGNEASELPGVMGNVSLSLIPRMLFVSLLKLGG